MERRALGPAVFVCGEPLRVKHQSLRGAARESLESWRVALL